MTFGGTLPEVSNLASFSKQIEFLDLETSEPMNLALAQDIIVTIAAPDCRWSLQGSLLGGEVVMQPDFLSCTVSFTRSQMQQLPGRTYGIGARLIFEYDKNEIQAALGVLPVVEGL